MAAARRRAARLRTPSVARSAPKWHHCPAPGCRTVIPIQRLACTTHWFALPDELRRRLNRTYRRNRAAHVDAYREALKFYVAAAGDAAVRAGHGAAARQEEAHSMTVTLAHLEATFGVAMLEHLDREAAIPTVTRAACQGDVSLLRVTTRAATTPIPRAGVPVVVGENGGNTHSLHGEACFDAATPKAGSGSLTLGMLTVPAGGEAFMLHPEHGGLRIAPGTYRIGRQREFAGEWRVVAD